MTRGKLIIPLLMAAGSIALLAGCERPPVASKQAGYAGVGMQQVSNPRDDAKKAKSLKLPDVAPKADPGGQKASQAYKNVRVLGDLTENELIRLMTSIAEWVAPEQGCEYCHNLENLADGSKYTYNVARRMLQMTRQINENWKTHVGQTGVTCYTCHGGNPVPKNVWTTTQRKSGFQLAGYSPSGQNHANKSIGSTSLPADPFTEYLSGGTNNIRVQGTTALPNGHKAPIQSAEATYALMIHMSSGLGVNCTACHNTRAFGAWSQSTPLRTTAWYGIRMVRDINQTYVSPLAQTLPAHRLGPAGDAPKANCATCHQGWQKPLNGAQLLKDYPELMKVTR